MNASQQPVLAPRARLACPRPARWVLLAAVAGVLGAEGPAPCDEPAFPFTIRDGMFYRGDQPTFLNILDYQPYEPCQSIGQPIRAARVRDDLERWRGYAGGSDVLALRLYPQPAAQVPAEFWSGVRELRMWVVRDIYFDSLDVADGIGKVEAVLQEARAGGFADRIFAWEFGNEFQWTDGDVAGFLDEMASYIHARVPQVLSAGTSTWVTWASWPMADALRSDPWGGPIRPEELDYLSINAYPYWPQRVRDHGGGPDTGMPYGGYLAALRAVAPDKPLVVSEAGLPTSPHGSCPPEQQPLRPCYPSYRYGGLTEPQAAEGLAALYWAARFARASGFGVFSWSDEWHKAGNPGTQDDTPEEHFGLHRFVPDGEGGYDLEPKLQEAAVRQLYALRHNPGLLAGLQAAYDADSASWELTAALSDQVAGPVSLRWEASRGHASGSFRLDAAQATTAGGTFRFAEGGTYLGPGTVTVIAMTDDGRSESLTIRVNPPAVPDSGQASIEVLTLSQGDAQWARASGRVRNVDLDRYKLISYILSGPTLYIQPFGDMKQTWIGPDGYWWTPVWNQADGDFRCWLVDAAFEPPAQAPQDWSPPDFLAYGSLDAANDVDSDMLPDNWEKGWFAGSLASSPYDDADRDWSYNLEELLAGTSPLVADDADADGLWDAWENSCLGTCRYGPQDDPDCDGVPNLLEQAAGTHPRLAQVPEPAALVLLSAGGLWVLTGCRRRRLAPAADSPRMP